MNSAGEISESSEPSPPRYWWLKRLVALSLLVLAGFAGLMGFWQHLANKKLGAEIAAIHARGEPILIEDFALPAIRDDQNAAISLQAAAANVALPTGASALLDSWYYPDGGFNETLMKKILSAIAQASTSPRALARLARFQPQADWGVRMTSPVINVLLPSLSGQRQLAQLLTANVQYEHLAGHDTEAIEILRDLLSQSETLDGQQPALVTHLVAIGISTYATDYARVVSYDLQILPDQPGGATTQPTGPASRQQVKRLIAQLLDERVYRHGFSQGMYSERLFQYDTSVNPVGRAALGPVYAAAPILRVPTPLEAMYRLDAIRMMRWTTKIIDAVRAPNFPAGKTQIPTLPGHPRQATETAITQISQVFSQALMPSLDRAVQTHFRGITERRVAAIRLAIRLYQIDHGGAFPMRLEQLVPDYLPELPADPFAADGRTFSYRPVPNPFLYSVGLDGVDNGGDVGTLVSSSPPVPAGHPQDNKRWNRPDVIFQLFKPAPLLPPTTNASN